MKISKSMVIHCISLIVLLLPIQIFGFKWQINNNAEGPMQVNLLRADKTTVPIAIPQEQKVLIDLGSSPKAAGCIATIQAIGTGGLVKGMKHTQTINPMCMDITLTISHRAPVYLPQPGGGVQVITLDTDSPSPYKKLGTGILIFSMT